MPTSLSIAIIGAGQIGSAFGYQLARAGHRLTMIARPGSPRLKQLQQAGGSYYKAGTEFLSTLPIASMKKHHLTS